MSGLQHGFKLFERRTVRLCSPNIQGLEQAQQFLRPELLVAPLAEAFFSRVKISPVLIRNRAGNHLIRGDHIFTRIATEQAGSANHTPRPELANRCQATLLPPNQSGLAFEQHKDSCGDVIRLTELLPKLKPQNACVLLETVRSFLGEVRKRWMLQQGKRRRLSHQEILKSLKSASRRLKVVAVCSAIHASNISWHIRSEISSVNVAGE